MLRVSGILLAAVMILWGGKGESAQSVAPAAGSSAGGDRVADHGTAQSAGASAASSPAAPSAPADTRTERQKALAMQTDRLFDMATELKTEVDKTNKNILSLKVVEKAEEIEAMAKGIRAQARK